MSFLGSVKLERWSRLLKPVDDMTHFAVSRAIGEGVFDYSATWRMNSSIIGSFIGCSMRAKVGCGDDFKLCFDIFSPVWQKGLEKVVYSINKKFKIPLLEKYRSLPLGVVDLDTTPWWQSLIFRESLAFYKEWPHMEENYCKQR